jgi:hypothetical protein
MRFDDQGRLREIVVHARPMAGAALFAALVGPRIARRRARWRGAAAQVARPLPRLLRAMDAAGMRVMRG